MLEIQGSNTIPYREKAMCQTLSNTERTKQKRKETET